MSSLCAQISLGEGLITAGAQLVELDLSDNAFGPDGVRGFEALLKSSACFTLHELKLNNCGMGIGGGKVGARLHCPSPSLPSQFPATFSSKVCVLGHPPSGMVAHCSSPQRRKASKAQPVAGGERRWSP